MLEELHGAVLETLEDLCSIVQGQCAPPDACARLGELRARHPETEIELIWGAQDFDRSLQYDAVIRGREPITVSLSVCPDSELPWPLRGVHLTRDSDLLRVDAVVLSVADAIARLDLLWEKGELMQGLINACIIENALRSHAIVVDAQDMQQALDAIRRRRGLCRTAQLKAWMEATGTTIQALERMAAETARARKLRDRLVGERAQRSFSERLSDFDLLTIARLPVDDPEDAAAALAQAACPGAAFYELAERICARTHGRLRSQFETRARFQLEPALCAALENTTPGALIGPLQLDDRVCLVKLVAVQRAEPNETTLEAAKAKLFREWLDERRREARIEWFWGSAERTAPRECAMADLAPWD
jgi:putative peptide maturation system protein